MNNSDIAKALQEAYEEGFLDGRFPPEGSLKDNYEFSDTRTLVGELQDGDITL